MKVMTPNHDSLHDLYNAIGAERTAEDTYAKFFFAVDNQHCEDIALLRLTHTAAVRKLETVYAAHAGETPEPISGIGPFTHDPRHAVFDIDIQLVRDYLVTSENQLNETWEKLVEHYPELERYQAHRIEKIERLLGEHCQTRSISNEKQEASA